jgi:two-component system, OmpR family, response regulator
MTDTGHGDTGPRRILAVDDEPSIRSFLVTTLQDEGYEVREAEHGGAALDLLATWTPHAILLDLYMPTMDGWTFRQEQRRLDRAPRAAVILMTASRTIDEAAVALGAAHHVSKPFDLDDLLDLLSTSVTDSAGPP